MGSFFYTVVCFQADWISLKFSMSPIVASSIKKALFPTFRIHDPCPLIIWCRTDICVAQIISMILWQSSNKSQCEKCEHMHYMCISSFFLPLSIPYSRCIPYDNLKDVIEINMKLQLLLRLVNYYYLLHVCTVIG